MNVKDYIVYETERQSGTMREAIGMMDAYRFAVEQYHNNQMPTEGAMCFMALLLNDSPGYRKVPAVFNQGSPAVEASLIPRTMDNLFKSLTEQERDHTLPWPYPSVSFEDYYAREFLLIHPFADGNGRVGSLFWNWLRGSLSDPEPMPYFFEEQ